MTSDSLAKGSEARQELSLDAAASHLLEECRTVVPGMQALFGFQLIAVFSPVGTAWNTARRKPVSTSTRMTMSVQRFVFTAHGISCCGL